MIIIWGGKGNAQNPKKKRNNPEKYLIFVRIPVFTGLI